MPTFGCHTCKVDLNKYADKPYEQWPCATCALSKDYSKTFSTGYFDTAELEGVEDDHDYQALEEHDFITVSGVQLNRDEIQSLETIVAAVSSKVCTTFAGVLVRFLHMAKTNPTMFEVLVKKLQFPYMSYSEIGDTMHPKCSKQNVLYHLKSAVELYPELEMVIQTDSRYSAGHYALKTIAERRRRQIAEQRLQGVLPSNSSATITPCTIEEINNILKLPFMTRDEVFTFNAYLQDETHIEESDDDDSDEHEEADSQD